MITFKFVFQITNFFQSHNMVYEEHTILTDTKKVL